VQLHTGYRLTKPHIGWMLFENDIQTVSILGAWSFVGANGQPGSMAIGNNLDVTHQTTDCARGECL
jgi:hypothetical protein